MSEIKQLKSRLASLESESDQMWGRLFDNREQLKKVVHSLDAPRNEDEELIHYVLWTVLGDLHLKAAKYKLAETEHLENEKE